MNNLADTQKIMYLMEFLRYLVFYFQQPTILCYSQMEIKLKKHNPVNKSQQLYKIQSAILLLFSFNCSIKIISF